jgi:hypothetical protein
MARMMKISFRILEFWEPLAEQRDPEALNRAMPPLRVRKLANDRSR